MLRQPGRREIDPRYGSKHRLKMTGSKATSARISSCYAAILQNIRSLISRTLSGRFRLFLDRNTCNDVLIWINAWYVMWAAVWTAGSQFENWVYMLLCCEIFNCSQLSNHAKDGNSVRIWLNRLDYRCESILFSSAYSQDESCNEFSKIATSKLFVSSSENIFR